MMTTKNIINAIQSISKESEPIICMEFLFDTREGKNIVTKLRDSVVVNSDEGSLLNYAVMKYSGISNNGSSPFDRVFEENNSFLRYLRS